MALSSAGAEQAAAAVSTWAASPGPGAAVLGPALGSAGPLGQQHFPEQCLWLWVQDRHKPRGAVWV